MSDVPAFTPGRAAAARLAPSAGDVGVSLCACGKIEGHRGRCPGPVKSGVFYDERRAWELARIRRELRRQRGNRTRTAAALGVPRTYLLTLMRKYGLQRAPRG